MKNIIKIILISIISIWIYSIYADTINQHKDNLEIKFLNKPKPKNECDNQCVADVQKILDDYRIKNLIPGMQMTINFANQPFQTFVSGTTTKTGIDPITPNTLFEIGSTTKSFTAAIIMQLVSERKLSLNDTLDKWLPEYPKWKDTTVYQLLHMTSVIFDTFEHDGGIFRKAYWRNPTRIWTPRRLVNFAYKHGPYCSRAKRFGSPFCALTPGKGWAYSNTNYVLLQLIAEKITNQSLKNLFAERIFKPLGLDSSIYDPEKNPSTFSNIAHAYDNDPESLYYKKDVTHFTLSAAHGAGAIISNTDNLAKWARALFSGKVLSEEGFANYTQAVCIDNNHQCRAGDPLPAGHKASAYASGIIKSFGLAKPPTDKDILWWHTGASEGHSTLFMYDAKHDFVIAITQNLTPQGNLLNLISSVEKYLFPDIPQKEKAQFILRFENERL